MNLFISTAPGLEALAEAEVRALGFSGITRAHGGLELEATAAELRPLNRGLRLATRVLVRMGSFRARTFAELERKAGQLDWDAFLGPGNRIATVEVSSRKSRLYHTGAIEERVRRVASLAAPEPDCDELSQRSEPVPAPPPTPRFVVRIVRDEVTISADSSGDPLHRRGYRLAVAKAPMRENLAAALVTVSGWDGAAPLVDPFCGSGTIPIEAALMASGTPPGSLRSFAFQRWSGHEPSMHGTGGPASEVDAAAPHIFGGDRDAGAIEAAQANALRAAVEEMIDFRCTTVSSLVLPDHPGYLVTNPPWGDRVGATSSLRNLYQRLGARLAAEWSGGTLALLCPDRKLAAQTGVRLDVAFRTNAGGTEVFGLVGRIP